MKSFAASAARDYLADCQWDKALDEYSNLKRSGLNEEAELAVGGSFYV